MAIHRYGFRGSNPSGQRGDVAVILRSGIYLLLIAVLFGSQRRAMSQEFKSGQGSPVHDSDRLYPLGTQRIVLENQNIRIAFDQHTGALVEFTDKKTGWKIQGPAELAKSFSLFAPTADRSYNPVLGVRNVLTSFEKSKDGQSVTLVWSDLESEYQGKLAITLRGTVQLDGEEATFRMQVENHSRDTISTVSWPVIGALTPPMKTSTLKAWRQSYGSLDQSELYPNFQNQYGYFGTNYPMEMIGGRYILISTPKQGLYIGHHGLGANVDIHAATGDSSSNLIELRPGYSDSWNSRVPQMEAISGHPVRLVLDETHFPFVGVGETASLEPVVISPYKGDWHAGVDVYKRWKATWFHRPEPPAWATDVNSWQQIQINSSEDDLRTRYTDLPSWAEQAAQNGVAAIQLVGWNNGGQDRGNPSQNTDPRLGTTEDLKEAIAKIQKMGVHVVLFNKYVWADMSTDWYKKELYKYMVKDPYGNMYVFGGYQYQTPEQLANINTRRFGVACMNDKVWRNVAAKEFQKVLDLGASGMLFDENQNHSGHNLCFSPDHGHHVPSNLQIGDVLLAKRFQQMANKSVGEHNYLFAGEDPGDELYGTYALSYFRIVPGHVPAERYADPRQEMMIAVTGFDDREMINEALLDRYVISYEPFNFKGNLDDFPLTMAYGKKVDALRKRYKSYLWDGEFRDTLEASVRVKDQPYSSYTVFRQLNTNKDAAVIVNTSKTEPITAAVTFDHSTKAKLVCASPEKPESYACSGTVRIPPRAAVVLMQR